MPLTAEDSGKAEATGEALITIRERANLGMLHVFGRAGNTWGAHARSVPLSAIPQEHWKDYQIDYLDLLRDDQGMTRSMLHGGSDGDGIGYSDLRFDLAEVDALWPVRRRRLRWQMPIVRAAE
jgi:hypothetical protein